MGWLTFSFLAYLLMTSGESVMITLPKICRRHPCPIYVF